MLLKVELWDVAPCGWAGTNSRTSSLVRDKQSLLAELMRLQVDEPRSLQTLRFATPAVRPKRRNGRQRILGSCNCRSFFLAVCISCTERLTAFLSGANRLLQIKNVSVTAATQPAACVGYLRPVGCRRSCSILSC